MPRSSLIAGDAWVRVARFLTAVFLLGGLVGGPIAHVQASADAAGVQATQDGAEPGIPAVPDAHHDCPVCLTLASVAAPAATLAPGPHLVDSPVVPAPIAVAHDGGTSDPERARAPPIS